MGTESMDSMMRPIELHHNVYQDNLGVVRYAGVYEVRGEGGETVYRALPPLISMVVHDKVQIFREGEDGSHYRPMLKHVRHLSEQIIEMQEDFVAHLRSQDNPCI